MRDYKIHIKVPKTPENCSIIKKCLTPNVLIVKLFYHKTSPVTRLQKLHEETFLILKRHKMSRLISDSCSFSIQTNFQCLSREKYIAQSTSFIFLVKIFQFYYLQISITQIRLLIMFRVVFVFFLGQRRVMKISPCPTRNLFIFGFRLQIFLFC